MAGVHRGIVGRMGMRPGAGGGGYINVVMLSFRGGWGSTEDKLLAWRGVALGSGLWIVIAGGNFLMGTKLGSAAEGEAPQ